MTATTAIVSVSHRYDAPPERVFDAFLDADVARRFLFATATGEMTEAQIEPRIGGRFAFTERRPEMGDVRHVGEYQVIERPSRLVFSFGVPQFDPAMTTVSLLIRKGDGGHGSVLTLVNEGVPTEYAEKNREGWSRILAGLLPAYDGVHAAGWR